MNPYKISLWKQKKVATTLLDFLQLYFYYHKDFHMLKNHLSDISILYNPIVKIFFITLHCRQWFCVNKHLCNTAFVAFQNLIISVVIDILFFSCLSVYVFALQICYWCICLSVCIYIYSFIYYNVVFVSCQYDLCEVLL